MVVDLRKSGHKHKDRESFTREVLCWLLALDVSMYRSAMVNLCQDPPVERADVRTKAGWSLFIKVFESETQLIVMGVSRGTESNTSAHAARTWAHSPHTHFL